MLLTRGELGIRAGAHGIHGGFHGHSVLAGITHALHAADGIGMALRNATAPERVVLALRQDALGVEAIEREHAGIPAHGNDAHSTRRTGSGVHSGKMGGNLGVGVEAVHHVEHGGEGRSLLGEVSGTAAAKDHDIDLALPAFDIIERADRHAFGQDLHRSGIAAGKNSHKLLIGIGGNGEFNTTAEVAITNNADSDFGHSIETPQERKIQEIKALCLARLMAGQEVPAKRNTDFS